MAQHEANKTLTVDWLTPKYIIDAFPAFDLDPCASLHQQWDTAKTMIRLPVDGLSQEWFGRVWLNPPYGHRMIAPWLERMAQHNNGVALIFARTETLWFHKHVWPFASGMFFFKGRLSYVHGKAQTDRQKYGGNAACPSVLVSYGEECCEMLERIDLQGAFVRCGAMSA